MAEKQLYEVLATVYAYACDEGEALSLVEQQAHWNEVSLDIGRRWTVADDWLDSYPYGDQVRQTCRQILQAQREQAQAAELTASVESKYSMNELDALRWCQAHRAMVLFASDHVRVEAWAASGVLESRLGETFLQAVIRLVDALETAHRGGHDGAA